MNSDQQMLIKFINNPLELDAEKCRDLVIKFCQERNFQLAYDGLAFCQLSGECIGEHEKIEIKTDTLSFVVRKDKLKELIIKRCFYKELFEESFSKIHNIIILNDISIYKNAEKSKIPQLNITEEILQQVFTEKEILKQKLMLKQHIEQINNYPNLSDASIFICPITQKKHSRFQDGINLQGQFISLEGAYLVLEQQPEKLFPHQNEFLKKVTNKKQDLNYQNSIIYDQKKENLEFNGVKQQQDQGIQVQNQSQKETFKCPITQNQYYKYFDKIKIQDDYYSVEEAIQFLKKNPSQQNSQIIQLSNLTNYLKKVQKVPKSTQLF